MTSFLLHLFLVGGGWDTDARTDVYQRFFAAAQQDGKRRIVSIHVAEEDDSEEDRQAQVERSRDVFLELGASNDELVSLTLTAGETLTATKLAELAPTAVFVWGGLTPLYQEVLTADQSWVQYLKDNNVVYGGFSAGIVIAAEQAVVGGWQMPVSKRQVAILDADLAEGLDALDVRPGLGLVPFSLDVHASQWGTVTRLMHAVEQQHVPSPGWAVDENTILEVSKDGQLSVWGAGQAYRVSRTAAGQLQIAIFRQGDVIQ
ncbi:hypothetical protein CHH28_11835 [Bacterioplanes sanyensis]|uniref:Peptidase S51 n=1 Tax=Bacterioplanes sanyensis TaxID=1249553 RepID=A0A222FLD1_9GAMM|nr:Type 1 glutamine amidotransferase-like domain-containing protein [Bacterioplanes sanyensis]ASP39324.1 hypothetical protein CHH28_11835 [Bacterioplanes sanyensis]